MDDALQPRFAFISAVADGLAVGDPAARHVLLTATDVVFRRGSPSPEFGRVPWSSVRTLGASAPRARWTSTWRWRTTSGVETAPVILAIEDRRERTDFLCDGFEGRGYPPQQLATIEAALHVLVLHPESRQYFALPHCMVHDLRDAHDERPRVRRAQLARAWGTRCACD